MAEYQSVYAVYVGLATHRYTKPGDRPDWDSVKYAVMRALREHFRDSDYPWFREGASIIVAAPSKERDKHKRIPPSEDPRPQAVEPGTHIEWIHPVREPRKYRYRQADGERVRVDPPSDHGRGWMAYGLGPPRPPLDKS